MPAVQTMPPPAEGREHAIETADSQGVDSLLELGLSYSMGRGVPQDLVLAHKWLNLAAQFGSDTARRMRAEIARDMTPGQIAEAQRLAREWQMTRH